MNYDLAMMALEGLSRSPISVRTEGGVVVIEGQAAGLKDLARLFLLLGGADASEDAFELKPGVHTTASSPAVTLRLS